MNARETNHNKYAITQKPNYLLFTMI